MSKPNVVHRIACLTVLLAAGQACGKSSPAGPSQSTTTTTVPPISVSAGAWQGSTPQGAAFGFTVTGTNITAFTIGPGIPGCGSNLYASFPTVAITGNSFTYSTSGGNIFSGTISGTFNSSTAASGNLQMNITQGCSTNYSSTWTANK